MVDRGCLEAVHVHTYLRSTYGGGLYSRGRSIYWAVCRKSRVLLGNFFRKNDKTCLMC